MSAGKIVLFLRRFGEIRKEKARFKFPFKLKGIRSHHQYRAFQRVVRSLFLHLITGLISANHSLLLAKTNEDHTTR